MKKMSTRMMVILAVLIALEIVLNRFLSINAWNIKIGFSFVPIAIAAILFGPIPAAIVGGVSDFVGAVLFPIGAYFPGFTLTTALIGLVLGIFLHKKQTVFRVAMAVGINQFILGLFLNTFWISVLYQSPFIPLLLTRIIQCAILFPVQIVCILALSKAMDKAGRIVFDGKA